MKKIIALICTLALLFTSTAVVFAEIPYGIKVANPNLKIPIGEQHEMKNGTVVIEAEDFTQSKKVILVEDNKASGGYALKTVSGKVNVDDTVEDNPDFIAHYTIDTPGEFYVWIRHKTTAKGTNDSVHYAFCTDAYKSDKYVTKWFSTYSDDYQWTKLTTGTIRKSQSGFLGFKHRVANWVLDKVVITNDMNFSPIGMNDLPGGGTGSIKLFPDPPLKPISEHPRLFITKDYIAKLKEYVKTPELESIFKQFKTYAHETINCKLEYNEAGNYNTALLLRIEARALLYAMGEVDAAHAKETISHMKDYLDTCVYNERAANITRIMGEMMVAGAFVYDWCYDQMTIADKDFFIRKFKETALVKEIGYPPIGGYEIWGHAGERELFVDLVSAGIACYDEDTEIYDLAAGRLFDGFVQGRKYFNESESHPVGSAYGHTRFMYESIFALIYDRMGYEDVLGENIAKVPYRWIYQRLPFGLWFKDGDEYLYALNKEFKHSRNDNLLMGVIGNMYEDPYIRQQYIQDLAISSYPSYNFTVSVLTLLLSNPFVEGKFEDELPLSLSTKYPLTTVTARTSWMHGINAPTAMAFMQTRETIGEGHSHNDWGSFQIYYKGNLAIDSGNYQGQQGDYGSSHDFNYNKRTIAHNGMLVYNPDEELKYPQYSNDGGQYFRHNGYTLEQYKEVGNVATTKGLYIGPNEMTPEFSYVKTDLTKSYTEKVADYKRSMVFMDLFDDDYPAAFVVFDKIDSSNKDFKKTWLLHSVEEPNVEGNTTTISRTENGFDGKLVNKTMLPENFEIKKVGGEGYEAYVNGTNYPMDDFSGNDSEQGAWRIELSPYTAQTSDTFLNAMYVTDHSRNLPELPMFKEETVNMVGVTVKDRMVLFSKSVDVLQSKLTIPVRDNGFDSVSCMIADLKPGMWSITGNGETIYYEVSEEENVLYFKGAPGEYTLEQAPGKTETQFTYAPVSKPKFGDFKIYDTKRYVYNAQPTKLIDGVTFIPVKTILEQYGSMVAWDSLDGSVTISGGGRTMVINPNSTIATLNGAQRILSYEPFVENGTLYVSAKDLSPFITSKFDDIARVLTINKTPDASVISNIDPNIVIPPFITASGNDGNVPENLIDFDLSTRWASEGKGEWVQFDLGDIYDIDYLNIAFYVGNKRSTFFKLEVSTDGETYEEVFNGKSSGSTTEYEKYDIGKKGRYIKLTGYGTNTGALWNSITEMSVIKK